MFHFIWFSEEQYQVERNIEDYLEKLIAIYQLWNHNLIWIYELGNVIACVWADTQLSKGTTISQNCFFFQICTHSFYPNMFNSQYTQP